MCLKCNLGEETQFIDEVTGKVETKQTKNINTDPTKWTRSADHWFLTGEPYTLKNSKTVPVSSFSNLTIVGNFRVQIIGHQDHNSVYIAGPPATIQQVSVQAVNNTLYLRQTGLMQPAYPRSRLPRLRVGRYIIFRIRSV